MPQAPFSTGHVTIYPVASGYERAAERADQELRQQSVELNRLRVTDAMEQRQERMKAAQEDREFQGFLGQASQQFTHDDGSPDYDRIIVETSHRYPAKALLLQDAVTKGRKSLADAHKVEIDNEDAEHKQDLATLQQMMAMPEAFPVLKPKIKDKTLLQLVGDAPDPDRLGKLYTAGLTEAERLARMKELAGFYDRNPRMGFLGQIAESRSPEDVDDAVAGARAFLPAEVLKSYLQTVGIDRPGFQDRAKALLLTEKEKQDIAEKQADNARQGAQAATSNAIAQGNLDVARGNLKVRQQEANKPTGEGGTGGAKLSATAIEKIAGVDQSVGMLDDIERLMPKMSDFIGPLDGRAASARLTTGVGVTPELAEFDAQLTGLKNAVVKATTGAAMSEPEAKRIMGQLPDLNLPEAVFKARLATTRKNMELLKKRMIELSGGTADAPKLVGPAQSAYKVGQEVTIKGVKHKITSVYPDGSFDAVAVKK